MKYKIQLRHHFHGNYGCTIAIAPVIKGEKIDSSVVKRLTPKFEYIEDVGFVMKAYDLTLGLSVKNHKMNASNLIKWCESEFNIVGLSKITHSIYTSDPIEIEL